MPLEYCQLGNHESPLQTLRIAANPHVPLYPLPNGWTGAIAFAMCDCCDSRLINVMGPSLIERDDNASTSVTIPMDFLDEFTSTMRAHPIASRRDDNEVLVLQVLDQNTDSRFDGLYIAATECDPDGNIKNGVIFPHHVAKFASTEGFATICYDHHASFTSLKGMFNNPSACGCESCG